MWRLLLLVTLAVVAQNGISRAQQPVPAPIFGQPLAAADQTVEEVQASTEELSKQSIPDKDVLLLRELDRLDIEIARATQQFQKENSFKNQQSTYAAVNDRLVTRTRALAQFDCENNIAKFQQTLTSYYQAFGELNNFIVGNGLGNIDLASLFFPQSGPDPAKNCNEAKSKFESADYLESQSQVLASIQKVLVERVTLQTNLANANAKYLDALKKRRASVQDKLNASQPAAQIGSNLWLLLLILAIACVGTILGIKLFEPALQMEWVASGQVIQFVTVMILLSVILALGLSGKLQENTLGTLLGGIAGYVLAQGVGRSAARNVANAAAAAKTPSGAEGATPAQ